MHKNSNLKKRLVPLFGLAVMLFGFSKAEAGAKPIPQVTISASKESVCNAKMEYGDPVMWNGTACVPKVGCPEGASMGPDGKCGDDGSYKNNTETPKPDSGGCKSGEEMDAYGCVAVKPSATPYGDTGPCTEGEPNPGNKQLAFAGFPEQTCKGGKYVDNAPDDTAATDGDPCDDAAASADNFCKAADTGAKVMSQGLMGMMNGAQNLNPAQACEIAASVAKKQALFSAGVGGSCLYKVSECNTACSNPDATHRIEWAKNIKKCEALRSSGIITIGQGLLQSLAGSGASNCQAAYNANAVPVIPPLAGVPAVMDCSNPTYAQQNVLTCFCQTHAGDPKCTNQALAPLGGSNNPRVAADTKGGTTPTTPDGVSTFGPPPGGFPSGGAGTPSAASNGGGGGAFGGPGGGGNVAAAGVAEDGSPPQGSANGGSVFGGFGSGQGGFSYGRGAGGSGDGSGSTAGGMLKSLAAKLNLNKILPKRNDYLNRSVAGMSGTSRDGVTGPNGPSIWEKVSRRYQIKKGELLPP